MYIKKEIKGNIVKTIYDKNGCIIGYIADNFVVYDKNQIQDMLNTIGDIFRELMYKSKFAEYITNLANDGQNKVLQDLIKPTNIQTVNVNHNTPVSINNPQFNVSKGVSKEDVSHIALTYLELFAHDFAETMYNNLALGD